MNKLPENPRVLITRTDNLGDVLLTLPVITALKKLIPGAELSFLIKKYTAEAVENYQGLNEILLIEECNTLSKLTALYKEKKFDITLNVYPRYNIALAGLFANVPLRVGTAYRWYSFLFNEKIKVHRKDGKRHESDYNLDLVRALFPQKDFKAEITAEINLKTDPKVFIDLEKKLKTNYNFSFESPFIIIHPFSKGSAKKWSPENFKILILGILNELKGYTVFLTGDNSEKDLVSSLISDISSPQLINIAGELSLKELIEIINMSRLFISNSTGPLHIAGALNKRSISFFPKVIPTNSERWKPLGEHSFIFEPEGDKADSEFIEGIDPESVIRKINEMLNITL